ncbi:MAG: hypothetical protein ACK4Q5_01935 [Saprospiraceae bacterium]
MEEKNRDTLENALAKLPSYEPPAGIWDGLAAALDADQQLHRLPQHEPPPVIWANIEQALENDRAAQQRRAQWQVFRGPARLAAAAAVLLALVGVAFFARPKTGGEHFSVRQEQVDEHLLKVVREAENPAFDLVQDLCRERQPVCQQPDFKRLKTELDELTAAKKELKDALGNFGDDPTLVAEMVKIERDRSRILEQMMQMI